MSRYAIGIDLGTTHCVLSSYDLTLEAARKAEESCLPIAQVTAPGTVEEKALLPSFLYLPNAQEFPDNSLGLPWNKKAHWVTGEFARSHGIKVPSRLVSSAKSWLSHSGVDRSSALLPWQAPEDVQRVSAVEASARYLEHLAASWNHGQSKAGELIQKQEIILTVPASFDAAARELTLKAATQAGLHNVTLLEEPQA